MTPEQPYTQFTTKGMSHWTCPACGHLNRHQIDYSTWQVQCGSNRCRRLFELRHVLSSARRGRNAQVVPEDIMAPSLSPANGD